MSSILFINSGVTAISSFSNVFTYVECPWYTSLGWFAVFFLQVEESSTCGSDDIELPLLDPLL